MMARRVAVAGRRRGTTRRLPSRSPRKQRRGRRGFLGGVRGSFEGGRSLLEIKLSISVDAIRGSVPATKQHLSVTGDSLPPVPCTSRKPSVKIARLPRVRLLPNVERPPAP